MLLMLMAASCLCCEALDRKSQLYRDLMKDYEKNVEPPLPQGVSKTTVKMLLQVRCVTVILGYAVIEGVMLMVSTVRLYLNIYHSTTFYFIF